MPTGRTVWRTGPNHFFSADFDSFRLVVQGPSGGQGPAHFYIVRRSAGGNRTRVASGTEPDVRAAMAAAEQMAEQVAGRQLRRD